MPQVAVIDYLKRFVAPLAAAAWMSGCGGGSGRGGGDDIPNVPPPPIDCAALVSTAGHAAFEPGSFGNARGPYGAVVTLTEAPNTAGAIYVGGGIALVDRYAAGNIARLNALGAYDPGFQTGSGFDSSTLQLLAAPDGSGDIYAAGRFTRYDGAVANRIIRLNCDGTRDTAFATGTGFDGPVGTLVYADDGSGDLYAGGGFDFYNGSAVDGVVRLNADGRRDLSFVPADGGTVHGIAPAGDGSHDIYVARKFTILRLDASGALDPGYTMGGFDGSKTAAYLLNAIAAAEDGSGALYVGGEFYSYNGVESNFIVRLNADGSRDDGFNIGSGLNNHVLTLAAANDGSGRIYVGGYFTRYNGTEIGSGIVRLNSDGSIDPSFATGSGFDGPVAVIKLAQDGSGDILVGGGFVSYNGVGANGLARLHPDGSIDRTVDIPSRLNGGVTALLAAADGSGAVYAGGSFKAYNGQPSAGIIRIKADGTRDAGFDVGTGLNSNASAFLNASDGSGDVYVGGAFKTYNGTSVGPGLIRLKPDGNVAGFNTGTGFAHSGGGPGWVPALASATDGSSDIWAGGSFTTYNGTAFGSIIRLHADGSPDLSFNPGGGFFDVGLNSPGNVRVIVPTKDGSDRLYVGGSFVRYDGMPAKGIVRLNADGSLDTAFKPSGDFNFLWVNAITLAEDGSGDLYIGGGFYRNYVYTNIARLNADGSVDPQFDIGSGFNGNVMEIVPAGDGSGDIYVGGWFGTYNGMPVRQPVRLKPDGTLDPTCQGSYGFWLFSMTAANDGTGDLYVGGLGVFGLRNSGNIARITASCAPR